jgi:drug/metabolite transporter (DMT)-like permease|tara:strand:- start:76202 stop:77104 length:903 start_codon:yes stop_codon:yes gene_type:complete
MTTYRPTAWLGLLTLVVMFGSAFLLTKIALNDLPPLTIITGRIVVAALTLWCIVLYQRQAILELLPYWKIFLLLALTGNCLPFFLIAWGQQYVDSGLAGILMAMMPLVTIILAHFFLVNERITSSKAVGFGLGFVGILILMRPDIGADKATDWLLIVAMLSILSGAVSYAANSVIAHQLPKISLSLISLGVLSFSTLIITPIWMYFYGFNGLMESSDMAIYSVIILGVFPTGLATIVYFSVIRRAGAAFLSQINYLIPLWAVMIGVLFGNEKLSWGDLVALVVILCGIAIAQRRSRNNET